MFQHRKFYFKIVFGQDSTQGFKHVTEYSSTAHHLRYLLIKILFYISGNNKNFLADFEFDFFPFDLIIFNSDSKDFRSLGLTYWAKDEPNMNHECVTVKNGMWYSTNCTEAHNVLCIAKSGKLLKSKHLTDFCLSIINKLIFLL